MNNPGVRPESCTLSERVKGQPLFGGFIDI